MKKKTYVQPCSIAVKPVYEPLMGVNSTGTQVTNHNSGSSESEGDPGADGAAKEWNINLWDDDDDEG